ncbi:MAG: TonB-dependent receptor plug domain-containing protein [Rhodospirillaceae bacterium]
MCTASALALMIALPAYAQDAASTQVAQATGVEEEIVVTGSRIVRNGYEAPTPVSVLGAEDLNAQAALNIADAVNNLPSFAGSSTPHAGNSGTGNGVVGTNLLNLRGMAANRTLVLLDGQRLVGASANGAPEGGAVDANVIPNMLVERVDVVTGGASAAYGSDALSGVVNFVLDRDFTGVKATIDGGISNYGDMPNYSGSLAYGTPFANGRGHVLLAAEHSWTRGERGFFRPWTDDNIQMMQNPAWNATTNPSVPQYIVANNVGLTLAAPGGIVTAGPLKGLTFDPLGNPYQRNYGSGVAGNYFIGGDWAESRTDRYSDLSAKLSRQTIFWRTSYDLSDNVSVYAQFHWAHSHAFSHNSYPFKFASETIRRDNAFLPAEVGARMDALGLTTLTMGRNNFDIPIASPSNDRIFRRFLGGIEGNFDAMGANWKWDAYYQRSTSHNSIRVIDNTVNTYYTRAIDAVRGANGAAVCRVNADAVTTNDDPSCVPFNYFGLGRNSTAALQYVVENGYGLTRLTQDVAAASVNGEPFSTWAGPVSVAFGLEHRSESLRAIASQLDQTSQFYSGNYKNSNGSNKVTEGFVETVVPLAKDEAFARSLDLNAAVRATDYSNSGYVTTWKVGGTWSPIDDIRFRATQSRDIRAPNMGDLFLGGRSNTGTQIDRFTNTTPVILSVTSGNPNLVPEKADTTGVGAVLSPSFLPGFNTSVDFYRIKIKGAIATLNAQQIIDQCFEGVTQLCPLLIRDSAGVLTRVNIQPANVLSQSTRGLDIEASYNFPLSSIVDSWDGQLSLRALGSRVFSIKTINNASNPKELEGAGVNAASLASFPLTAPKFTYRTSATYALDPLSVTLSFYGLSSGVYATNAIQCTTGCPVSTTAAPTLNNNHIPAVHAFDLSFNYKIIDNGAQEAETFFVVNNLTNAPPPGVAGNLSSGVYQKGDGSFYQDYRIGRTFRAGVRFKM